MVNLIVLITYLIALATFIIMSIMAIQHTVKFGYISRSFKSLAWTFGLIAVILILYSAYLMTNLFRPAGVKITPVNSVGNIDY